MSRLRPVLLAVLFAACLLPMGRSDAASTLLCSGYSDCSGSGYSHHGYSSAQSRSWWNMYTGTNCTNYVAYRLVETNGLPNKRPRSSVGNARDWGTSLPDITDSTPSFGSVAWWGRSGRNHVAYVERVVSSSEIVVSESNWGRSFDWRRITKSGGGWPDGFIHFDDLVLKNTAVPTLAGTVKVGGSVKASRGTWSPSTIDDVKYQWQLGGANVSGATGSTYTPRSDDEGRSLRVRVTAYKDGYPTGRTYSGYTKVLPARLSSPDPTVSGTPRVDTTLSASRGTWSPTPTGYSYRWKVDGALVGGHYASTFTPRPDDVGKRITVQVTAARSGYSPVTIVSDATNAVSRAPLWATARPRVSTSNPTVGVRMSASSGSWSSGGTTSTYRWLVDGTPVPGATSRSFTPRPQDLGKEVVAEVSATRPGYETAMSRAAATWGVAPGTIRWTSGPSVWGGTPLVGGVMKTGGRVSTPGATYRYQWLRHGYVLTGETGPSHELVAADLGRTTGVRITVSAPGYRTTTVTATAATKVRSRTTLTTTVTPGSRRAVVRGTLAGTGVPRPVGTVYLRVDGRRVQKAVVVQGNVLFRAEDQKPGRHTYTLEYAGNALSTTASSSAVAVVTR